ncbi:MAG: MarR family transcriptional regulator [Chloroflexi bacterium]|nr:MarR family transcriptional regulator [Chloroflexota bacterium]
MAGEEKSELASRFAELMANVVGRMKIFSLAWPYEPLSQTQMKTLILLGDGPRSMRDISEAIGVVLPSATRIVDSLVHKGMVKRSEDSEDRRRVLCSLTEEGRLVMARLWKIERKRAEMAAQLLKTKELTQIVDSLELLDRVMARSDKSDEGARPPRPATRSRLSSGRH